MSEINPFLFAPTPHLHFGEGKATTIPSLASTFGPKVLLVTGANSFLSSAHGAELLERFKALGVRWETISIPSEPSPDMIDDAVHRYADFAPQSVVAVGGGSVLDAGKAISAMLPLRNGVKQYLEGVGSMPHPGVKLPYIAVPTTSGTGSEATKNAVLSEVGDAGFKRSLRHNRFVPDAAVVDPLLTVSCPRATTATSGMDAFTQLLESFLSTASNPLTDAWALEGLRHISSSLASAVNDGENTSARTGMALASYLSGVTLANAGLGLVHGFASPIGGYFDIPHGVICSRLMGPSNRVTVRILRSRKSNSTALQKYAAAGSVFAKQGGRSDEYYTDYLLDLIERWTDDFNIPSLRNFGISENAIDKIADATDAKNNPTPVMRDDLVEILKAVI